jgi:cytochrome P450
MMDTTAIAAISPAILPLRVLELCNQFDLRHLSSDFLANPYPVYAALRASQPVKHMPDGSWFLTRYQDVVAVYKDANTFRSDKKIEFAPKYGEGSPLFEHHTSSLVFNDPPLHTRVRKIIMGALTRRAIADMEPGLVTLVDHLLDRIAAKAQAGERACLIEDFASAIPVEIIGNLLGVPHADRGPLRAWSLAILGALEPVLTPAQLELGQQSVRDFKRYLEGLIADRRRHPGDPDHDVLTRLIFGGTPSNESADAAAEPLTAVELVQNCIFILNAGHETTTNLIGNTLITLQEYPSAKADLLARLSKAQSAAAQEEILNLAVDEFLRFESSNQLGNRRAALATEINGIPLPAGSLITLCIGAANRDPAQFENPDELNLARTNNKHLAFGFGLHQCAGLSLARLEGRIAVGRFLARFPNYTLSEPPVRGMRARFRGFARAGFLPSRSFHQ